MSTAIRNLSSSTRWIGAALACGLLLFAPGCAGSNPDRKEAGPGAGSTSQAEMDITERETFSDEALNPYGLASHWRAHPVPRVRQAWYLLDNIYITREGGEGGGYVLEKIDGESGRLAWSINIEGKLEFAPEVYRYPKELRAKQHDELFFVQHLRSGGDHLFAVDDKFGREMYRVSLDFPPSTSPTATQDYVMLGSWNGRMFSIAKSTKIEQWTYLTDHSVTAPAEVGEDFAYVGSEDNVVYAFKLNKGFVPGESWSTPTGGKIQGRPLFYRSRVYVGSWDYKVYCLDTFRGYKHWSYPMGSPVIEPVFPFRDWVFAVCQSDNPRESRSWTLVALGAESGKRIWERKDMCRALAADSFHLFALDSKDVIHALRIEDGKTQWSLDAKDFEFVLGQHADKSAAMEKWGRIFLIKSSGIMQCLRPRR